jgi:methylenetetrahydrofolate--tRNA-(uracil-5-)-methyltransferase
MHRNSFMDSPGKLTPWYELKAAPGLFFAGQLTGVEGYVESASSGFTAGINMARKLMGSGPVDFTDETAIGSLGHYVSEYNGSDFQPMNVTFGIMASLKERIRNKRERYEKIAERALERIDNMISAGGI